MAQSPPPDVLGRLCADLRTVVGAGPASGGACALPESTAFPLTRDIYSLVAALILAATPVLVLRQWTAYRVLVSTMLSRGSLSVSDGGARLAAEVTCANRAIEGVGRFAPLTMLAVAVCVAEIMSLQAREGVFAAFAPDAGDQAGWRLLAHESWWASDTTGVLGHATYFAVATWGLYLITQQNVVGFFLIRAIVRSRDSIGFGADPGNTDGRYGWSVVRHALVVTHAELALHGLALACIGLTLPPGGFAAAPFAIASYQWGISLLAHIAYPFVIVRGKVRRYKAEESARLEAQIDAVDPALPEHERIAIQDAFSGRIALVRAVPVLPFKSARDTLPFSMSIVADTAAVVALVISLVNIA